MRERARIVWRQQVRLNIAYATVSSRFARRRATPSTFFVCGLYARTRTRAYRAYMRVHAFPPSHSFHVRRPFVNIS